ncbi:unnamed protein product [Moneuplotes crassus]|uniref:Uncharacterized protein n=1 Tax=Euplotes crassus TaxID=5936 RepID=A0AAD1X9I8_EUPCR|nr:unnamed protein product [Moneuplotes crassus]
MSFSSFCAKSSFIISLLCSNCFESSSSSFCVFCFVNKHQNRLLFDLFCFRETCNHVLPICNTLLVESFSSKACPLLINVWVPYLVSKSLTINSLKPYLEFSMESRNCGIFKHELCIASSSYFPAGQIFIFKNINRFGSMSVTLFRPKGFKDEIGFFRLIVA